MSLEAAALVRVPGDWPGMRQLLRDIRAADKRARLSMPGERTEIARVESLTTQLERMAAVQFAREPGHAVAVAISRRTGPGFFDRENDHELPPEWRPAVNGWLAAGDIAVELRFPFGAGPTYREASLGPVVPPENPWPGADPGTPRYEAIALRFRQQIAATLEPHVPPNYIEPSGVNNTILTETLREFVGLPGETVRVPVRYQDGSIAAPFPLRGLPLRDSVESTDRELRLALLSIRHTEMDVEVDGCWLRNFEISRPRPAAETDQHAYQLSEAQLATLTRRGSITIYLYQTGLDPAVVGFYRAVTELLITKPGSVNVVPKYFRHPPRSSGQKKSTTALSAFYVDGRPWAT